MFFGTVMRGYSGELFYQHKALNFSEFIFFDN